MDVSPLVAASLAVWAVDAHKVVVPRHLLTCDGPAWWPTRRVAVPASTCSSPGSGDRVRSTALGPQVCAVCPVRAECLREALAEEVGRPLPLRGARRDKKPRNGPACAAVRLTPCRPLPASGPWSPESDPEDWEQLEPGPTYLYQLGMVSDRDGTHVEATEHVIRAVYRSNVELGLAWGPATRGAGDGQVPVDRPVPRRQERLPDVCGHLVQRRAGRSPRSCVVDGGHAVLPPARMVVVDSDAEHEHGEIVGEVARPYAVAVARLIHTVAGRPDSEFGRYMREAGIVEVPDEGPGR